MSDRTRSLRQMKRRATALLLVALAVFVVARSLEDGRSWLGYVRATAEAAMVGGLADWFAVTALFRRPLGLPIPHTAIVRTRKDQLGHSLGQFVQDNFLSAEVVSEKLHRAQPAVRLADWLTTGGNSHTLARHVASTLAGAFDVIDDEEVSRSLAQAISERLRQVDAGPAASRALTLATADGRHHQLVDAAARGARRFLDEHRRELRARFGRESPWWVPEPVDDRIFDKLHSGLSRFLDELIDDPAHELRHYLDSRLAELAERLRHDPELAGRANQFRDELVTHPAVHDWMAGLWSDLKRSIIEQSADPESGLRARIAETATSFGRSLHDDPALRTKFEQWLDSAVRYVIEANRHEVAELIETTVARWDADEAADRIELQVGRDLQFIRINGTVVGGLAGLAIYSIAQLF